MRTRPLGGTSLTVSELALGTWGLAGDGYGAVPDFEQDKVIDRALALGFTLFETADSYGRGAMERRLGARLPRDGSVRIVTKLGTDREASPPRKCFTAEYLTAAFERSRERLDREVIDVVLLHNPAASTVARGEATQVLRDLAARGAIRAWGVSAGSAEVGLSALAEGAQVVSLAHHPLARADLDALRAPLTAAGAGLLIHSVLFHGLLCGYWSLHKTFPAQDHRSERWTPDDLRRRVSHVSALRSLIGGPIGTVRGVALRYAQSTPEASTIVLGPRNVVQLDMLVRDAGKEPPFLTPEQLDKLHFQLGELGAPP